MSSWKRVALGAAVFFFTAAYGLLRGRYDVVQCCTFMDTYAAALTRRFTGTARNHYWFSLEISRARSARR